MITIRQGKGGRPREVPIRRDLAQLLRSPALLRPSGSYNGTSYSKIVDGNFDDAESYHFLGLVRRIDADGFIFFPPRIM
jgi:hypothetical protein